MLPSIFVHVIPSCLKSWSRYFALPHLARLMLEHPQFLDTLCMQIPATCLTQFNDQSSSDTLLRTRRHEQHNAVQFSSNVQSRQVPMVPENILEHCTREANPLSRHRDTVDQRDKPETRSGRPSGVGGIFYEFRPSNCWGGGTKESVPYIKRSSKCYKIWKGTVKIWCENFWQKVDIEWKFSCRWYLLPR